MKKKTFKNLQIGDKIYIDIRSYYIREKKQQNGHLLLKVSRNKDKGITCEHYIPYNHLNANRVKCGGSYIFLSKRRYKKYMLNLMNFEINR
jgi:hypothetical protein